MTGREHLTTSEQLRRRGICVVIPTYNNVGTIIAVVAAVLKQCADIIVVNDGSTDGTAELLRRRTDITLVDLPRNCGKGYALKQGFREALRRGFAYAITLDGDGQHYAESIPAFLEANIAHPGCLIVGERRLDGVKRSRGSAFANRFSNFWFYVQTGCPLRDTQTGYRLYPLHKLHGLSLLTSRYEAELELLVFASWHGTRLRAIPVDVYYPPREERVTHFRPVADFARISVLNTVLCLLAVVYGLPCRVLRLLERVLRTVYSLLFFVVFSLFIITPAVWLYLKIGRITDKKRERLHRLIYHISCFVVLRHGIPGTRFTCRGADNAHFDRPAVLVCNHQSHLDLVCKLLLTPKLIFLTNDWVWHNPFYGTLIRGAEFLPASEGIDTILPHLRSLRDCGYSIAVYPEGTRSVDCSIGRFHQGAFYIAQQLDMDVLPVLIYGPGKVLPKKGHSLHRAPLHVEIRPRVTQAELRAMGDLLAQTRHFHHYYVREYAALCDEIEQRV